MMRVALPATLIALTIAPLVAEAQTNDSIVVTTNDTHDYAAPDREVLEFENRKFVLEVDYKNSPSRELSKISATCFGRRTSFVYDHTYFVAQILPLMDRRRDEHGRVTEAYFQLEMRTERSLKEPDRVIYIECRDGKIETSIMAEAVVP